jgi:adenylate cyclase
MPTSFDLRIGINVGDVVGGIVGQRKFHYSVWGDAVNVASRMQSNGIVGAVNLSRTAWDYLEGRVPGNSRGLVDVKGKGAMEMFVVAQP